MTQFSNVTYTGAFSGSGTGTEDGQSTDVSLSGFVTVVLSEAADGSVTGNYSYEGGSELSNQFGSEGGPPFSGGGTVSGTEGSLTFTRTSGPLASGTGSLASNDTVLSFGAPWNFDGAFGMAAGSMNGNPFSNSSGVPPGSTVSGSVVVAGAVLVVSSGGTTVKTVIRSGGGEIVSSGGVASATQIDSGGSQIVWGIGSVTYVSGGLDLVQFGGTEIAPLFTNGELDILSGGTVIEGNLNTGNATGTVLIQDGGVIDIATLLSGVQEFIGAGGLADAQNITGAGAFVAGTAENTTVNSGGSVIVSSGGVTSSTQVTSSGEEIILAGGVAYATFVYSGGDLAISVGGIASGLTIEGGTVALSGGAVNGSIDFNGSGTLDINGTAMPSNAIIGLGFNDLIDLAGVAFGSGGSATLEPGNVWQIVEGGSAYDLDFDPSQNFASEQFLLSADPVRGTDITLHPAVSSGQTVSVAAFHTSSSVLVETGGVLDVLSGGIASGTIIDSGGVEQIGAYLVESGGIVIGSPGGESHGTIVLSGGTQDVEWGIASATNLSGGSEIIEGSGTVNDAIIEAGGVQFVGLGSLSGRGTSIVGFATGTIVGSGGTEVVADGVAVGTSIGSGGLFSVGVKGIVSGASIDSGGSMVAAGAVSGITVDNGSLILTEFPNFFPAALSGSGMLVTTGGGTAIVGGGSAFTGDAIISGATLELANASAIGSAGITFAGDAGVLRIDGTSAPDNVVSGFAAGDLIDLAGLSFSSSGNIALTAGNVLKITEGASSYNLNLQANQLFIDQSFQLSSGASGETEVSIDEQPLTSSAVISNGESYGVLVASGGIELVLSGGTGSDAVVSSAGEQYVGSDGTSLAAQVEGGGAEVVFGTDSGASLSGTSAATGTQYDFGIALGGTTYDDGFQEVALAGAVASGMNVEYGGEQYVGSGGTTLGAQIASGGAEVVFGFDSGASLSGTQYDFGTASGGTTYDNGFQEVAPGAVAVSMTVESGGQQYIGSGGTAIATDIAPQGAEVVFGSALGAAVSGTQYDFDFASGGTTYNDGFQLVAPGAVAIGMNVESGGEQYVGAGGSAFSTDIAAQGAEVIFGTDSGALISGTQYVFGIASGGTTFDGGSQQVEPGGTAIGMTVSSGGQQYVGAGGTAIGTDILSQGAEVVHGTDLGATISGTQYVDGLASGTVVATGGYQLVSAGGTISAASISGGTIELQSGASDGAAPITFTGAGELILDASALFSGSIAGFGSASLADSIDFADIPYVASGSAGATTLSWTQLTSGANGSGTLLVSEGGHSADITLFGQYMAGNFALSSNGHGGSLVTDPPLPTITDPSPLLAIRQPQAGTFAT